LTTVTVENLKVTVVALEAAANLREWATRPLNRTSELLINEARDYPDKDPSAFRTLDRPKQKRAYWAKVHSGEIQHGANGYVRTNKLRDSWDEIEPKLGKTSARTGIEGTLPYNQFVMGERRQQFHKRSGWLTGRQLLDDNEREITDFFDMEMNAFISRRLR